MEDVSYTQLLGGGWYIAEFILIVLIVNAVAFVTTMIIESFYLKNKKDSLLLPPDNYSSKQKIQTASQTDREQILNTINRHIDNSMNHQYFLSPEQKNSTISLLRPRIAQEVASGSPAPIESGGDGEVSEYPFSRVDIRLDRADPKSGRMLFLDGKLPSFLSLPVSIEVSMIVSSKDYGPYGLWPPDTVFETIDFYPVVVDRMFDLIKIERMDGKHLLDSIVSPVHLIVRGTSVGRSATRTVLFENEAFFVHSPIPLIEEIASATDFVLLRITEPTSVTLGSVTVPESALDANYELEFPRHLPRLSRRGESFVGSGLDIVKTDFGGDLNRPVTLLIYASAQTTITRDLFDRIKTKTDKTIVLDGTTFATVHAHVSLVQDPARPDSSYVSMRPSENDVPSNYHMVARVLGFSNPLSDKGGYNAVFPVNFSSSTTSIVSQAKENEGFFGAVDLHNTSERGIGFFGSIAPPLFDSSSPFSPVTPDFFRKHIRPVILVRHGSIVAVFYAPLTTEGAKTGRLPRRINIDKGYIDVDSLTKPLVSLGTIEAGNAIFETVDNTETNTESPLIAIFPSPVTIPDPSDVYPGLSNVLGEASVRVITVGEVHVDSSDFDNVQIIIHNERITMNLSKMSPVFLKGIKNDEKLPIKTVAQSKVPVPYAPNGNGFVLSFTQDDRSVQELFQLIQAGTVEPVPNIDSKLEGANAGALTIICRWTSPPRLAGYKIDYHVGLSVGGSDTLTPDAKEVLPDWAFDRNPNTNSSPPRHIFMCAVRTVPMMTAVSLAFSENKIWLANWFQYHFTPTFDEDVETTHVGENYRTASQVLNTVVFKNNAEGTNFKHVYESPVVTSEKNDKFEKILIGSKNVIRGPFGFAVVGSHAFPAETASKKWRNAGDLTLVNNKGTHRLPVSPVITKLKVWSGGEPMFRATSSDPDAAAVTLLRLDPRLGGAYCVAAMPQLLAVMVDMKSGHVKSIQFLDLYWTLDTSEEHILDHLVQLATDNNLLQDIVWNRNLFSDNRTTVLCVKIPSFENMTSHMTDDHLNGHQQTLSLVIVDPFVFTMMAYPVVDSSDANRLKHYKSIFQSGQVEENALTVPSNFVQSCGFDTGAPI